MEKFHHTPLFGRDAFRVMILHPKTDPGVLNGEFVPLNSCLTPDKEALSCGTEVLLPGPPSWIARLSRSR